MSPGAFDRWAYRHLGDLARWVLSDRPDFALTLRSAGIHRRPDMYLAGRLVWMLAVAALLVAGLAVALVLHLAGVWTLSLLGVVSLVTLGLIVEGTLYAWTFLWPSTRAFMRGEEIDDNLPFAVNYMASMATAGLAPERLFESLARQEVYGELAVEAAAINRDVHALGRDLVTALSLAADRSPSHRFEDFLDGAITSITAGGALPTYLEAKADQYMEERRQDQTSFLDSLGILAESYVTVAVAGPMFVIVMLSVLVLFGNQGDLPLTLGYLLMLLLVPLVNAGFVVAVETISPKV